MTSGLPVVSAMLKARSGLLIPARIRRQLCKSKEPFWGDYDNPLVVACFQGYTEVVQLLIDAGADPDSPFEIDVAGEQVKQWGHPLWLAANRGHYEVVKLLLDRGANPNTAVYASGNAVCWAYQYGHKRIADLMFQHGSQLPIC